MFDRNRRAVSRILLIVLCLPLLVSLFSCTKQVPPSPDYSDEATEESLTSSPPEGVSDEFYEIGEKGGYLLPKEDFNIQEGKSDPGLPTDRLCVYTTGVTQDSVPVLLFDLSPILKHTTAEQREVFGTFYLGLRLDSVPSDAKHAIELTAYAVDFPEDGERIWATLCGDSRSFTPTGDPVASVSVSPDQVGALILLDVTGFVLSSLEEGKTSVGLALIDAKRRCTHFLFDSSETAEPGNEPQIFFGNPSGFLRTSVDTSDMKNGKVTVAFDAKRSYPSTTVTLTQYAKDGTVRKVYSDAAELLTGRTQFAFSMDTALYQYGDTFAVSYQIEGEAATECYRAQVDMNLSDKFTSYLEQLGASGEAVTPTGIDKSYYAEVTAFCLAEYNRTNPLHLATVESLDSTLQSFSRVLCSMAVVVDYGKDHDITPFASKFNSDLFRDYNAFRELFAKMMRLGCDGAVRYAGKDVENFSVKELAIAYELTKDLYSEEERAVWRASLAKVQPDTTYYSHANKATNRNAYLIGGEQLRAALGIADSDAVRKLVDASLARQMSHFDENGMYRDNYGDTDEHDPMLYDLTTRVQLQLVLGYGYDGAYAEQLNQIFRSGGYMTLFMMSSAGELAYGGRSNQYLFNMALISANCEYEARYYENAGDSATAGAFKRTAHLAIQAISDYLAANKHIMNYFKDPTIGTDSYGNYDKYMVTMSSFLSIAYLFADESIEEAVCPAERGGYCIETSGYFNAVIATVGGYTIEILTSADDHYDSTGLGRIHRAGVYTALGLSSSITGDAIYTLPSWAEKGDISLEATWYNGSTLCRLSDYNHLTHTLRIVEESDKRVEFVITYTGSELQGIGGVEETYVLTAEGLDVSVCLLNPSGAEVLFTVPLLLSNGDNAFSGSPVLDQKQNGVTLTLNGEVYTVTSDADSYEVGAAMYANRNGVYRVALFRKAGNVIRMHFDLRG